MKRAVAYLAIATIGLLAGKAAADCCNDCGCQCDCRKVCRCVPTTKKITKICYSCECEDFCIPGPSKICGYKCVCPEPCEGECKLFQHAHKEPIWQPGCAKVKTRSRLVKQELVKEVPSWKWEVVDLCPRCKACTAKSGADGQSSAAQLQAPGERVAGDYYSQNPAKAMTPVAQSADTDIVEPADQQTELVSHTALTKVKRMWLPSLAK